MQHAFIPCLKARGFQHVFYKELPSNFADGYHPQLKMFEPQFSIAPYSR